jgi:hypothetical protein
MNRKLLFLVLSIANLFLPAAGLAGMPSFTVTQLGQLRLQEISFFLVVFLLASWGVQRLWNYLAVDLKFLPRIGYRRSVAMMVLWGLVFVVVLTMISGARELMTPQAWEPKPNGWTHQLANQQSSASDVVERIDPRTNRIAALVRLHLRLVDLARKNNGVFPESIEASGIESVEWEIPGRFGLRFGYEPGLTLVDGTLCLVHEPMGEGASVLAIRVDGGVSETDEAAFQQQLAAARSKGSD